MANFYNERMYRRGETKPIIVSEFTPVVEEFFRIFGFCRLSWSYDVVVSYSSVPIKEAIDNLIEITMMTTKNVPLIIHFPLPVKPRKPRKVRAWKLQKKRERIQGAQNVKAQIWLQNFNDIRIHAASLLCRWNDGSLAVADLCKNNLTSLALQGLVTSN